MLLASGVLLSISAFLVSNRAVLFLPGSNADVLFCTQFPQLLHSEGSQLLGGSHSEWLLRSSCGMLRSHPGPATKLSHVAYSGAAHSDRTDIHSAHAAVAYTVRTEL